MNPLYQLSSVSQVYGSRTVLTIDSLTINTGTITGIVGPNGSGKSTLMRLLAFLETPSAGTIFFNDKPASVTDTSLRRKATLMTQHPYLLKRTVKENVEYGLNVRNLKDTSGLAATALKEVGLEPEIFLQRQWFELSGGEAQRVALASRLVLNPEVLLMDEPTSSLDEESTAKIREAAFRAKKERGTTLVIVSHDREWLTSIADRIVLVRNGKIEQETAPER